MVLYTYHIPWESGINWSMDAGDLHLEEALNTHNDVTCLERLLFARTLLSRLRDWLVNKEAETAVQEDWYVWGTAQCLLCCASTKL